MKTKDIIIIGLAGAGLYLAFKASDIEKPDWFPEMPSMPSIDLSGLLAGLTLPSIGGLKYPEFKIPTIGNILPNLPELKPLPSIEDLLPDLFGKKGEGEEDVTIAPQPSEQSWSDVVKGFVSEHPLLSASIAIPVVTATTYGAIKVTPAVVKALPPIGRGLANVLRDVYSTVKLPAGFKLFKPVKTMPKVIPTAGRVGIGGVLGRVGLMGLAATGAATIADWVASLLGVQETYVGKGLIEWFSLMPEPVSAIGQPKLLSRMPSGETVEQAYAEQARLSRMPSGETVEQAYADITAISRMPSGETVEQAYARRMGY